MESLDRSTIWPYDERGEPGEFYYARYAHPTGVTAEARLGALEGGDALLYASGMGAATTVLLTRRPRDLGALFGLAILMVMLLHGFEVNSTASPLLHFIGNLLACGRYGVDRRKGGRLSLSRLNKSCGGIPFGDFRLVKLLLGYIAAGGERSEPVSGTLGQFMVLERSLRLVLGNHGG